MKIHRSVYVAFAACGMLALAACGGADEPAAEPEPAGVEPEATSDAPAAAPADETAAPAADVVADEPTETTGEEVNAVAAACEAGTNMSAAICACVGRKASELSEVGQKFVAASLGEDTATAESLRSELGVQGAMKASSFLVNAPRDCAAEAAE